MKIKIRDLLDFLFCVFVFASIIMSNTTIGKSLMLIFIVSTLIICFIKEKKFKLYHFFELLFVMYIFLQTFFSIAIYPEETLAMGKTMIYSLSFSIGLFNYLVYRNDVKKVINLYANTTIITFILLLIVYYNTLADFRLSAYSIVSIFNIPIFGGNSSTSLAMMCTIPAFLLATFFDSNDKKSVFRKINALFIFSVLTGTRKTMLAFIAIYIIYIFRFKSDKNILYIFLFPLIVFTSYILIMNVPIFYNVLGVRIENALNYEDDASIKDSSIVVRNRMKKQALLLFEEKKKFGWGMDYFKASNRIGNNLYSHNNYLEILSGGGIVGFVLYYIKYLYLLVLLIKTNKKKSNYGFMIMLIVLTVLELWQVTYFYRYIMIYQIFILYYLSNIKGEKINEKKKIII